MTAVLGCEEPDQEVPRLQTWQRSCSWEKRHGELLRSFRFGASMAWIHSAVMANRVADRRILRLIRR